MLPSKSTWAGAVAIAAVALAACDSANSGVTAPDSPIEATGASSARPDASTVIQEFRVCKTYVGVVGPAVTVDFTVDFNADGPGPQDLAGSVVLAEGDCAVVHTYDESNASGGTQVQRVTVTEQVLAGYGASYVLTETVGPVTTVGPQTPGSSASGDMISSPDNGFTVDFINTEIVNTVIQEFQVCKTYVGAVGPTVTVDFAVDFNADGPGPQDLSGSIMLADGDCALVHTYDESNAAGGTQIQRVTVMEQVPAGYGASYVLTETVGPVTTVGPQTPGNSASGDMISNPDNGFIVEFINTEIVTGGGEGCTPGYWKQSQHFDSYPAGFDPMTPFIGSTTGFSYDPSLKKPESGNASDLSLLGALTLRGGQQNALIRHAATGILNANSSGVSYDLSLAEVQNLYNVDLDKGALERANQQGCPLN